MQIWIYILIFVIGILGFLIFSMNRRALKRRLKYDGKFIVDFYYKDEVRAYLCVEQEGEVKLSEEYAKKYTAKKSKLVKLPKDIDSDIDTYYLTPGCLYDTWWPSDRKKKDQVKIKKTAFVVGIPLPIIYLEQQKWSTDMLQTLASQLMGLSRDKDTLRMLDARDSGFFHNLDQALLLLGKLSSTRIAAFAAAGLALVGLIMIWQMSGKITSLAKMFLGG